jgi:hypothetical protein
MSVPQAAWDESRPAYVWHFVCGCTCVEYYLHWQPPVEPGAILAAWFGPCEAPHLHEQGMWKDELASTF